MRAYTHTPVPGLSGELSQVLVGSGIQSAVGAGTTVGGVIAGNVATGAAIGTGVAASLATAGIAAAGIAIMSWVAYMKRNGMRKEQATAVADKAEGLLKENLDAWNASNKTLEDQQTAYANTAAIMDYMLSQQGCGNPNLGDPGQRCISERLVEGARYPWLEWYVDPIRNYAPTVSAQTAINQGAATSVSRTPVVDPITGATTYVETTLVGGVNDTGLAGGMSTSTLMLLGGVAVIMILMGSGK